MSFPATPKIFDTKISIILWLSKFSPKVLNYPLHCLLPIIHIHPVNLHPPKMRCALLLGGLASLALTSAQGIDFEAVNVSCSLLHSSSS